MGTVAGPALDVTDPDPLRDLLCLLDPSLPRCPTRGGVFPPAPPLRGGVGGGAGGAPPDDLAPRPKSVASRRPRASPRLNVCGIRLGGPRPCVLGATAQGAIASALSCR